MLYLRALREYFLTIVAFAISLVIVNRNVSYHGYLVPNNLATLAKSAAKKGYKVPASIPSTCLPKHQVTPTIKAQTALVTHQPIKSCSYTGTAWHHDLVWGFLAVLALLAVIGVVVWIWNLSHTVALGIVLVAVVVAYVLGGLSGHPFYNWLTHRGVNSAIFWRGFWATLILGGAGVACFFLHNGATRRARRP